LSTQLLDLLLQPGCPCFQLRGLRPLSRFKRTQVTLDTLFNLLLPLVDLSRREVTVASVGCLELAPVNGN
jgi:hypothetical protein